jgi:hypothetical protein
MTRWSRCFLVVVIAAALLPACGGGGGSGGGTVLAASQTIDAAGGTVTVTDPASPILGATVVVPPGALAAPTLITISQVVSGGPYPSNVLTIELGPAGTVFAVPVTVTVPYLQQYLTDLGIADPATLHVVRRSGSDAPETLQTESRDDVNFTVTAETSRFSTYAVLGYSNASSLVNLDIPAVPYTGGLSVPILPTGFASDTGTVTFDGSGGFSFSGTSNEDGTTVTLSGSGSYSIASDGTLTLDGNLVGGVLSGGSAFTAATTSGEEIQILVGIKKSGSSSSNASLSGTYAFSGFAFDVSPESSLVNLDIPAVPYTGGLSVPIVPTGFASDAGTVTFDGSGGFSFTGTSNEDGATVSLSGSGSYSVASDGALTLDSMVGGVLPGGNVFVAASTSGDETQMLVGIKKSGTSFSNASLSGTYAFSGFLVDVSPESSLVSLDIPAVPYTGGLSVPIVPDGFASDAGTVTFDGSGGFSYSTTSNEDGTTVTLSGTGSYSVASDGALTIDSTLVGSVLPGGSMFIAASTSGDEPQILVGILKK